MGLVQDAKMLAEEVQKKSSLLEHNCKLYNIYEGDLLTYVLEDLAAQLSPRTYATIKYRVAPINVLRKLVEKLSKIYPGVEREIDPDTQPNEAFFQFYLDSMNPNVTMGQANENFNLYKNTLVEPYMDMGKPKLRTLPSDRFIVHSTDPVNPLRMTHLVKIMGKYQDGDVEKKILYMYTDEEFLITDEQGKVNQQLMRLYENSGQNQYGKIPGIYINRSRSQLTPIPDTDTLQMTKMIPILLTDLNFAVMFQSFSTIYTIDVDMTNITQSPNAIWNLKSDKSSDKSPTVGTIKPEVDIDQVINMLQFQLAFWMNTRNIKPGSIGALTKENFASGISKMVDEMDTSEDREKQTEYFAQAEQELWDLVLNHMHPVWITDPSFAGPRVLSPVTSVKAKFCEQKPLQDESQAIKDAAYAYEHGLKTLEDAVKMANPDLDEDEVPKYIAQIKADREVKVEEEAAANETLGLNQPPPNGG